MSSYYYAPQNRCGYCANCVDQSESVLKHLAGNFGKKPDNTDLATNSGFEEAIQKKRGEINVLQSQIQDLKTQNEQTKKKIHEKEKQLKKTKDACTELEAHYKAWQKMGPDAHRILSNTNTDEPIQKDTKSGLLRKAHTYRG